MKKRTHRMNIWPDMEIRVDKRARMGVSSTISRADFRRLCVVHDALENVNFDTITVSRTSHDSRSMQRKEESDILEVIERMDDISLRDWAVGLVMDMSGEDLRRVALALSSYSRKDLLI